MFTYYPQRMKIFLQILKKKKLLLSNYNNCWTWVSIVCSTKLSRWGAASVTDWWAASATSCTCAFWTCADSPSPRTSSSAKRSSVSFEATGMTEVWAWSSTLMFEMSKSGKAFLIWQRVSPKLWRNESPSSEIRASKSRYSHIATSLAWRTSSFRSCISLSLPLRAFFASSVLCSRLFLVFF